MRWVLDTTAFSNLMRRDIGIENLIKKYPPKSIWTVPPVIAEIQYGIERLNPSSRKYLLLVAERDRLLFTINTLPWAPDSSLFFGKIKADLERRGKLIDDFDIAIGAIALSHQCGVITANMKHFQMIKNLECMDW